MALSYFEGYVNLHGDRTLRAYSRPANLARFARTRPGWATTEGDLWFVAEHLATLPHTRLLPRALERRLSRVDRRSLEAGLVASCRRSPRARGGDHEPGGSRPGRELRRGAALAGVSFEVQPNTVTSLIGPNGAGKTTLFNAITGYLRPSRGSGVYEGQSLTRLRPDNVMIGLHLRGSAGWVGVLAGRRRGPTSGPRRSCEADRRDRDRAAA